MRKLGMRHLQLGLPATQHRPVLAPVELERLARGKHQRHERTAPAGLRLALPLGLPGPDEGGHAAIRSVVAQHHEVGVHLLCCTSLFARLAALGPQPTRKLLGKWVNLARPLGNFELGFNRPATQVLADRVARQTRAPLDLPDRHLITKVPAPDNAQ
jgi:hypothetical protein